MEEEDQNMNKMGALGRDGGVLGHQQQPKWFTPERLLIIFCIINMLNYVDRGAIASNGVNGSPGDSCKAEEACAHGSGIQGDFRLSNFQDGILSSAFMVGLLVASLVFAEFSKRCNPFRLIGVGLSVWTLATAGCGLSTGFWSITFFRMLVGVGEASFVSLAAPFIDDNAPPNRKTAWLSIFYMCIPVGVALGYVFGGLVGSSLHWRAAFFIEAILMLPFAVFGFVSQPISLRGSQEKVTDESYDEESAMQNESKDSGSRLSKFQAVFSDFKALFQNRVYLINVLGYVAFNFVLGAYSYWGPKAGEAIYHMKNADFLFGAVTIICGIAGTVAGGLVLDYMGSTIANGFKLLAIATFVGGAACFFAFLSKSLVLFIFLFAVGELFIFATQGPVNHINLQCVAPNLRALSMATSTVFIHVFGDVPSSPLVGALEDRLQDWRPTALILTSVYFLAAVFWACGFLLFFFGRAAEPTPAETHSQQVAPLLED